MQFEKYLKGLGIQEGHINRGVVGQSEFIQPLKQLLTQQQILDDGINEQQIKYILDYLAALDTSNDPGAIRIGEREGRIASSL